MNLYLTKALAITLGLLMLFGAPGKATAQVQDAFWQKEYCLDERGTIIPFVTVRDALPPTVREEFGDVKIFGDTNRLAELSERTATFLFTRACLKAVSIKYDQQYPDLECRAASFLAKRFNMSPHETLLILEELSTKNELRSIARNLNRCR